MNFTFTKGSFYSADPLVYKSVNPVNVHHNRRHFS